MRVYVSSTSVDLAAYRRSVIEALTLAGYDPVCMERQPAAPVTPKEECLRQVRECKYYVGIFAWRYGFVPPGEDRSITHLEFLQAESSGHPTFIFLLQEEVPWPDEYRDAGEIARRMQDLRSRLKETKWVAFFTYPDELATKVLAAIRRQEYIQITRLVNGGSEPENGPAMTVAPAISGLPGKLIRHFQDRDQELERLRQCLSDETCQMAAVIGRGGVGKTSLIAKALSRLNGEGLVYLSLLGRADCSPDSIVGRLSQGLAHPVSAEIHAIWHQDGTLRERIVRLINGPLARRRFIIVLDNVENVMGEDNHISPQFSALREFVDSFVECDHVSLLIIASRRSLLLSPEAEIGAIGKRIVISLDEGLPEHDAAALLRLLGSSDRRLGIAEAQDETLRDLARRCHCLPRTVEMLVVALKQHPTWSLDTLVSQPAILADLLVNPARELYRSLPSDHERFVMQALAIYRRPVPGSAIRHLFPALPTDSILDRLVLDLAVSHDSGCFWLHPLDQSYAYDQIPDTGPDYSKETMHRSAARFYLGLPVPTADARASFDDLAPLLAATEHLLDAGEPEEAAALFVNRRIHEDLGRWGHYSTLGDLCGRLLSHPLAPEKQVALLIQMGKGARNRGGLLEARQTLERALLLLGPGVGRATELALLNALGDIHYYLGDLDVAEKYLHRAEGLWHESLDPLLHSETRGDLGNVMMARQRLDQAEKLYASAIEDARRAQNPRYEGIWNGNLGNLYSARFHANGDASHREQAVEYLSRAISLAVQTRDLRHESHWNGTLGQLYWALGQTEPALRHLLRAFGLSTQILYGRMIDTHARLLALLYIHRRSFPDACRVAAEFHEAARKSGNGAILLAAQQFHLDVIATVAQAGASKLAITQGRVFAALADDPLLSARLAVLCLELGRTTTQASFRQFAVDLLTEALAACPEAGQAPLYSARANAHALLGKLAPAIADYAETIRRDPQNVRVAMSRAEVLIWSGSYEQARTSLEDLSSQLRNDGDSIIHAWLMCHALNLQGEDFTPHRRLLESKRLFDGDLDYDFQGIEAHLRLLRPPQVTRKQQENTEKIQDLIAELAKWNRSRDG